jgi:phytoene dehydrogenase-like protein
MLPVMVRRRYDAIVVGAGLGGLAAAAALARSGRSVLVAEREGHPGGTAYCFPRGGYWFPMGPLGLSSPAPTAAALAEVGVDLAALGLARRRYRVRAFGLDAPLSLPLPELADELAAMFPAEAPGVREFFAELSALAAARANPADADARLRLERAAETSAAAYLDARIRDPRLQRILGSIGTGWPYASLDLLAAMWDLVANQGVWRPAGGMRALADRLAQAATQAGAELALGSEVETINVADGRAVGVELAGGTVVAAPVVIANADFKTTFLTLIDPEATPEEFFQMVFAARQTASNFQVCLGLDPGRADLAAFASADSIIYRADDEGASDVSRDSSPTITPEQLAAQELELSLIRGQPAGPVLVIRTEAAYGHFTRYRPLRGQRLPAYRDYKTSLARALIAAAGAVVPGLAEAVRVMDAATPLTFAERGGRSEGAIAGWSWDHADTQGRPDRDLVFTPIAGLFMAGHQAAAALSLGGVPTALLTGLRAASIAIGPQGADLKGT